MTDDLEKMIGKKITGAGYEETVEGCFLMLIVKGKEFYFRSDEPIELDLREIQ